MNDYTTPSFITIGYEDYMLYDAMMKNATKTELLKYTYGNDVVMSELAKRELKRRNDLD